MYCGNKIILQEEIQKIQLTGPVELQGLVYTTNHEFESKLAIADNHAEEYFRKGPDSVKYDQLKGYDAVVKYYADAGMVGANESKYYVHWARFYVKANLERLKKKAISIDKCKEIMEQYELSMNRAIRYARPNDNINEIQAEKEHTLKMLNDEFAAIKKKHDEEIKMWEDLFVRKAKEREKREKQIIIAAIVIVAVLVILNLLGVFAE